jgi:hypothetical protein
MRSQGRLSKRPNFSLEPAAATLSVCYGRGRLVASQLRRGIVSGGCGSVPRSRNMRVLLLIISLSLAGCSTTTYYDSRLDGNWRYAGPWLGREWTITYSDGLEVDQLGAETNNPSYRRAGTVIRTGEPRTNSYCYRIVRRGSDYLDIRRWGYFQIVDLVPTSSAEPPVNTEAKLIQMPTDDLRLYFSPDRQSFRTRNKDSPGFFIRMHREPDGAANRGQPVGSETNRTSSSAGPGG